MKFWDRIAKWFLGLGEQPSDRVLDETFYRELNLTRVAPDEKIYRPGPPVTPPKAQGPVCPTCREPIEGEYNALCSWCTKGAGHA